ncbi:MAG: hypothetical protein P8Y07_06205, partial [Gemmatimonadales bacterium]
GGGGSGTCDDCDGGGRITCDECEGMGQGGEITDTGDPAYLSIVNPYGINPATGNTYCEDNDNCPDDGFGEPEEKKEDVEENTDSDKDTQS